MNQKGLLAVLASGLIVGLLLVWWLLPKWLTNNRAVVPPAAATAAGAPGDARMVKATLFFVSEDGTTLVAEPSDVPFGASPTEQARHVLEAQLAPSTRGRLSAIPAGVTIRAIYFTSKGDAYVDLSREIITGHPGGSLNEALTIYTIVFALTTNVREITAVQILVDGKQLDTLAGHIDLRQPLAADSRWVQKGQ
ncbi:MAG: hypothetical protein EPO35_10210 [Acidobacteria bacterium]|nr:MAG: hypothetical protein EPO35_10210 [Acidobacteriota bacterium]